MTTGSHGESLAMGHGSHSAFEGGSAEAPRSSANPRRAAVRRRRRWGLGFVAVALAWVVSALLIVMPSTADAAVVCTVNKTIARGSSILIDFTGSNSGSACNITIAVSVNTAATHGTLTREPVGTSGRNRRIIYTHTDTSNSANSDSFVMDGDNFGDTINVNITIQSADLQTSVSNSGAALQGQTGYVINGTVSNQGTSATSGTVTATYSLPTGVTATAISGTGWTCTLATTSCTRSDALATSGSYPTVDLTVSFASNATSPKVVSFTASGLEDNSANNSSSTSITVNSPTPTVTGVAPTSGPAAGGTSVVITGTNFTGATGVSFGGTAASSFTVDSATQITATAPAHAAGAVDVSVTTPSGTSANTAADDYTYVAAPTVTSISPTAGPTAGGTTVVVTGTNFSAATAVSFGGTAASGFTVNSATQITATAPAGTGTVDVRVTTVGGTSATSAADQYTYIAAPTVTNISPASGGTGGGASVTITGTNFTTATAVSFGGTAASGFTVNSATSISATSPAHAAGTVDVRVTTLGGTSAIGAADQFTYNALTISPSSPLTAATVGTAYSNTISASGGTGPYTFAVTAGSLPAGLSLASDGSLTGTPTAGGSFNFTVTATDTANSATNSQAYALTVNAPTITVSPNFPANQNVGQATNLTFTASGGTSTYSWAVTAGSLPAGITLNPATGVLSGTATEGGTFNFTLTATDSSTGTGPYTGSHAYTLLWQAAIVTTTGTLGDGTVGQAYSQTLGGSGGTAPYSFQITGGALPAGLSLNGSTGEVSGTPTASGAFTVFIVATDSSTGTGPYFGGQSYNFNIAAPTVSIDTASVGNGTVGVAYTDSISASGGTAPYSFSVTAGALPAGISLASDGTLSGTPTEAGSFNFTVTATDSTTGAGPYTATQAYSMTVAAPTIALAPASLSAATVGSAYSDTVSASGGTAPYTYAVTAGSLPAGLSLASDGSLTGTPTAGGTFNFTVTATDSSTGTASPFTGSRAYSLTVNAPTITVSPASLSAGSVGSAYSDTISASGGTSTYSFAVTAGSLPAGMSLASDGTLSGTPTAGGTFNFTVTATDSSTGTGPYTGSRAYSLTINAPTITLSPASLSAGSVGSAYSDTISASGGVATYSFAVTAGSLPAGMSLASDGALSGTPTAGGTFNFTVTATDSSTGTGPYTGSRAYSLTINAPTITLSPIDTVDGQIGAAYSDTVSASGGIGPYSYAVTGGSLPAGLSLNGSTGEISGTPTEGGSFNVTITATDSSTGAGPYTGSQLYSFDITAPTITLSPASLASGSIGAAYSDTVSASGGTSGYTFAVTAGSLPNGLSLASNGALTGTPTAGGTFNFTVTATDSSTGAGPYTGSRAYSVTIGAPTITLSPASLPAATVASAYSQSVSASGGTAGYSFAVTAGSLPAGITLASDGTLSGTATAAGTFNFTVTATDSSGGAGPYTGSRAYSLTVNAPTITVSPASLPNATVAAAYSQSISASGGTSSYSFAVTAGSLPAGLTLASNGTLSGTPTAGGTFNFTVTATDSTTGTGPFTGSRAYSLTVDAPTVTIDTSDTLAGGTVGSAYSQTITASGATSPYSFAVTGGSLPAGLTLASNGALTGTPTAGGNFSFTITATDSSTGTGPYTASKLFSLSIGAPTVTVSPAGLSNGAVGQSYSSSISASGGTSSYSFAVTAGSLPPGTSLASNGALTGTPTAGGTFNFTVTATDSSTGTGPYTGSRAYSLTIDAPTIALSPLDIVDGEVGVAYGDIVSASGGTGPYSYAVTGGALPAGITLNPNTGLVGGTPTEGGSFNVTITATDQSGGTGPYSGSRVYSFDIVAPTITVSPASIPDGDTVTPVNFSFSATGGTGPRTFAVTAGSLPPGLSLSSAGVLTGTPNVAGDYNFTVTATDSSTGSGPYTGSRAYAMHIEQAIPEISPASLPNARVGVAFSQTLTAVNGNAPYTFAVTAGALPAGLTLSSGGALTGTPTEAGVFNITVSATDSSGAPGPYAGFINYTLTVAPPALTLTPESASGHGKVGVAYSLNLHAGGGSAPYSYAITAGALPTGVSLNASTGAISGTPTEGGTFTFTVTATDSSTGSGSPFTVARAYTLTIDNPTLVLTPTSLPAGRQTVAYSQTLSVGGGVAPYAFAVTSGALPAGLSLNASTGEISGVPTVYGAFDFTVTATDSSTGTGPYTAARAYHLTINPPPAPTASAASATVAYNSAGTDIDLTPSVSGVATSLTLGTVHPQHGTVSFNGMIATYTPTAGYFGADSFSYRAVGPGGTSPQATVSVTVSTPPAPVTTDASAGVAYNSAGQAIDLSGHVSGVFTSLAVGTQPTHGTVQIVGTTATYVPASGYFGADSFTFTATGPGGTSSASTVTLTVAAPAAPVVTNASASVAYNSAGQAIDLSGNVSGVYTGLAVDTQPAHGTVQIVGTTATYVPTTGYFGADSFTFTATGPGGTSAPATVSLTVATPAAPTVANASANVAYNSAGQAIDLSGNVSGVFTGLAVGTQPSHGTVQIVGTTATYVPTAGYFGADSFTFTATGPGGTSAPATVSLTVATPAAPTVTNASANVAYNSAGQAIDLSGNVSGVYTGLAVGAQPAHGTVQIVGTTATYVPTAGYFGADSFTFTATGPGGTSAAATVSLTVASPPPPVPTPQGGSTTVTTGGTTTIPIDNTGGPVTGVEITDQPDHGTVEILGGAGAKGGETQAATGFSLKYTPTPGYVGPDSFQYRLVGPGGPSASVTVNINVTAALPTVQTFNVSTTSGGSVSVAVTTGATGGPFSAVQVASGPSQGTAVVNGQNIVYTAPVGFTGSTSFTYTLTGPGGVSAPGTVNVTVNPVPVAQAKTATTLQGVPVTVNVSAGATGGPITGATVTSVTAGSGTATVTQTGSGFAITYTPAPSFSGTAVIGFTLNNAFATSAPQTLTVTVQARPDPSQDPDVKGLVDAQDQTTRRFAETQLNNFNQRLERLHGEGAPRSSNGLNFNFGDYGARPDQSADQNPLLRIRGEESPTLLDRQRLSSVDLGLGRPEGAAALSDRLKAADDGKGSGVGLWTTGVIDFGQRHRQTGQSGVEFTTQGISFGADVRVSDNLVLGAGGGFAFDKSRIGKDGTLNKADTWVAAVYGSWRVADDFYVDGVFGGGSINFDTRRFTPGSTFVFGQREGDEVFGSVSFAWDYKDGPKQFSPYGRVSMARANLGAYTETGDPIWALAFGEQDVDMLTGTLGMRGSYAHDFVTGVVTPHFRAEYHHQFEGNSTVLVRYADLLNGPTYSIDPLELDRNSLTFGLGVDWKFDGVSFSIDYEGGVSDNQQSNRVMLKFESRF